MFQELTFCANQQRALVIFLSFTFKIPFIIWSLGLFYMFDVFTLGQLEI